jgi:transglutaminase-like putative cysteine protease
MIFKISIPRCLFIAATCIASTAFAQYKSAYTTVKSVDIVDVKPNGGYTQIIERLYSVDTQQGIAGMGELRVDFNEKLEEMEVLEAYTLLPDGSRMDVPADKIKRQDGDGREEYSDGKVLVIIFPKVDVGSQVYYRARRVQHTPYFPGHFFWSDYYTPHAPTLLAEVHLVHPAEVKMVVDTEQVEGGVVNNLPGDAPGTVRYRFSFKQATAYPAEAGQSDLSDYAPHLAFTTFSNYAEFGQAYQARAKPMAEVTPAIATFAKELTAKATDDRTKVRILYNWVSQNIRYVAVYVAEGGFVPHPAQSTLDNRYGDCKDHVTLLEALLSAVGIESTTALVNSGDALRIPKVATSTPFNHAITYIPKLDLYLDSTSRFSPMGTLPFSDTGKPTLLTATGTIGKTPMTSWKRDYLKLAIKMRLNKDGSVRGESTWTARGIEEVSSRARQFGYKNRDKQEIVNEFLEQSQETGTGEFLNNDPSDFDTPWQIGSTFQLDSVVNMPGPTALTIPYGLVPSFWRRMAAYKPPQSRRFPSRCGSRSYSESITLTFPKDVPVMQIPRNVNSNNGAYHYAASYRLKGQDLQIQRSYAAKRETPLCPPNDDKHFSEFRAVLRWDMKQQVFLK